MRPLIRALVTKDDIPPGYDWWPFARIAYDHHLDPEVVMRWPMWKVMMMSNTAYVMHEWEKEMNRLANRPGRPS